ncbi:MAG: PD40 domain-containing protein [Candidatus Aminicenantes bacterium]|nr:PD40 domain-containing protein [Candidatus Aminicenantes bacterium]
MKSKNALLGIALVIGLCLSLSGQEEARLLRFPAIHGNQVVFTYAGDLYTVPAAGGTARKLTSHPGYECFARFSPDGSLIAFTGEYDGNREVYVMPALGGVPKRLTHTAVLSRDDISDRMGPNNIVMGWTPDGKNIVFRSRMIEWNSFNGQLFTVPVSGGLPAQLPLPRGGFCSYAPDGTQLAYNRVFREFRTWKRYRGGMADDIWIRDFTSKKTTNLTSNPAQDIIPMWSGETVYFLSDRDENKRMNLYACRPGANETRKLTDFAAFDIKFPSLGPKAIVFENGGFLYRFDLATEKAEKIPVVIADDKLSGRTHLKAVADRMAGGDIAPDGKRVVISARGDIFTVPAKYGNTRNLTATPGVHDQNPAWSPDGKWIAYMSDASGTEEYHVIPQDGSGPSVQVTSGGDTYKYGALWSPDSKKLLWGDKLLRLNVVDVATKKVTVVDQAEIWEITDYAWSPDSRWIAYTRPEIESQGKIILYSLASGRKHEVTDGWYAAYGPEFSADGKYLFFVSDRDFRPYYSRTEWNHAFLSMARIYFVTLAADTKSPFEPKSDEVGEKKASAPPEGKKPGAEEKSGEAKPGAAVKVDVDGLGSRVVGLPVEVANYRNLASVGDSLYYLKRGDRDKATALKMYSLADQKETELGEADGFGVSADKKKMLVMKNRALYLLDLPKAAIKLQEKLDLSGMEVVLDLKKEWEQIFLECWRQMKYFFYAPNMHGLDWEAVRDKYLPLARAANHRADLTYVIGEMIGELSAGHTYVGGGDLPDVARVKVGLLGARLVKDGSGYYRIEKIYRGQNWTSTLRNPLLDIGVNVKEGDFILAVNGRSTAEMTDIYASLVNTAGKQVTLKVNASAADKGSREVVVVPIDDEQPLTYFTWVQENIEKVSRATEGRVGYLHIPDMGVPGLIEFIKYFYPQLRKKALIIDVRGNGGGNVSPMVIDRLRRELAMIDMSRDTAPRPDPEEAFLGPLVCLCDEFSASDGDLFPYRFKKHGLGKLIGKRTWGGVVGIRGSLPLLDGGVLNKPEFAPYSADGKEWIIEGVGVEPDIIVDNDPAREFEGIDDQLNKAIEVILEELKTKDVTLPPIPPYPIKK